MSFRHFKKDPLRVAPKNKPLHISGSYYFPQNKTLKVYCSIIHIIVSNCINNIPCKDLKNKLQTWHLNIWWSYKIYDLAIIELLNSPFTLSQLNSLLGETIRNLISFPKDMSERNKIKTLDLIENFIKNRL